MELLVWIRGVSKNPLPSFMVGIGETFFLLPAFANPFLLVKSLDLLSLGSFLELPVPSIHFLVKMGIHPLTTSCSLLSKHFLNCHLYFDFYH